MLLTEPYYLFVFNLAVGIVMGTVLYRADYCMATMFRDIFLTKDYTLLRSLYLLIIVAIVIFSVVRMSGAFLLYPPPPYSYPSVATLAGGFIFGVGMVLAGGCVVGTLYKMAGGNLTNLIAFGGIISGSMLYAEFHPLVEVFRRKTTILKYILLSEVVSRGEVVAIALTVGISLYIFLKWNKEGKWRVTAFAEGYLQPWKAALIIALLNALTVIFSGWPMGVTTAYAKMGAYIEQLFIPSHAAGVPYFNQNSLIAELPGGIIAGGAGPGIDLIFLTELPIVIGIVLGAFATAVFLREFKIYGLPPKRQAFSAFVGGVLIALGVRIASGCNIKFILGAVPLFAFQGVIFLIGMLAGAYIGAIIIKKVIIGV